MLTLKSLRQWRHVGAALLAVGVIASVALPIASVGAEAEVANFDLVVANPKLLPCLAKFPDNPNKPPQAHVTVQRGDLNDTLSLKLENVKPNIAFDLFTVENSNKLADLTPDPNFKNFGLAWYQTDLESNDNGRGDVKIKTVLLDQIFGFDAATGLAPTNTFHVGFWFNSPKDVEPCLGQVAPTPFNGEHNAGPLAMISAPVAATNLGPLCINPDSSSSPIRCNP